MDELVQKAMNEDMLSDEPTGNIGDAIKYLRKKRGHSLEELAERANCSASYLNRLELHQKKNPSIDMLRQIAVALEVSEQFLLNFSVYRFERKESEQVQEMVKKALEEQQLAQEKQTFTSREENSLQQIMLHIVTCPWTVESKMEDMLKLNNLVHDFKYGNEASSNAPL